LRGGHARHWISGQTVLRSGKGDGIGNRFLSFIGRTRLLLGQVIKGGLIVAVGLNVSLMAPPLLRFKTFAEISSNGFRRLFAAKNSHKTGEPTPRLIPHTQRTAKIRGD
jgi:hypothetical protein